MSDQMYHRLPRKIDRAGDHELIATFHAYIVHLASDLRIPRIVSDIVDVLDK